MNPEHAIKDALKIAHAGAIHHDGPGRTDDTPMHVKGESFVIPADVVSSLGDGNTANGFKKLDHLFGGSMQASSQPGDGSAVPIIAAGGEYVVPPEAVQSVGGGDIKRGHEILRAFVVHARKKAIDTMKKLPKPVRK